MVSVKSVGPVSGCGFELVCCSMALFLGCGDFAVVGTLPVACAGRLVEAVLLFERESSQVCQDAILERRGPVSIPLSRVAQLYDSVTGGLAVGQLARVVLESLVLKRRFLSLVRPCLMCGVWSLIFYMCGVWRDVFVVCCI